MTFYFHYIFDTFPEIGLIVILIGFIGILENSLNFLISMISIEIMLYGVILFLVLEGILIDDFLGQSFSLFVLTLAACESAGALGLLMNHYKIYKNILLR